jgi:TonB family protein
VQLLLRHDKHRSRTNEALEAPLHIPQFREVVNMRIAAAVALFATLGCATTTQDPLLLSDWKPPGGQACRTTSAPDPLPTLSEVIDSTGLVSAFNRELSSVTGYALLSLASDSAGPWTRVRPIESDTEPGVQESLAKIVSTYLKPAGGRWYLRLRVALGDRTHFALGASQMCSSVLRNADEVQRLLKSAADDLTGRGVVVLHVHTDELGRPGEVMVARSSGDRLLDAAAARIASRMRFHPALNDRVPVAVWTEVPLIFH